jgi:proteasome lid subunit RPN8/RPN11
MKKPAAQPLLPVKPIGNDWTPIGEPIYEAQQPTEKPKSDQGNFSRGFETAMRQIPQTIGGTIGLIGDVTGSAGVKDFGMGIYDAQSQKIQNIRADSDSFSNVLEGKGEFGDFVKYGAGYVGGQALSTIATGGLGALVGREVVKRGMSSVISDQAKKQALARAGAISGGVAIGGQNLVQSAGSIYPEALEQATKEGRQLDGGDFARIGAASVATAAVDTAMDALGLSKVLKGGAGSTMMRRAAREVPMGMGREGVTEGIQTGIERYGAGKALGGEDAARDYIDSVALGTLGGGFTGAATSIRGQKQPEIGPLTGAANAGLESKAQEADTVAKTLTEAAANPAAARMGGINTDAIRAQLFLSDSSNEKTGVLLASQDGVKAKTKADVFKKESDARDAFVNGQTAEVIPPYPGFKSKTLTEAANPAAASIAPENTKAQVVLPSSQKNKKPIAPTVETNQEDVGTEAQTAVEPKPLSLQSMKQKAFSESINAGLLTKPEVDALTAENPKLKVPQNAVFKPSESVDLPATVLKESRLDGKQDLGMQNRDRSKPASVQQMNQIANSPDYDRLGAGKSPNDAAPMVSVKNNAAVIPDEDKGLQSRVTLGDGSKIKVQYAVVEADSILASHNVDGIENAAYFGQSNDGTIKALNNGRSAGLAESYRRGKAGAYRTALAADFDSHGVSSQAIADKKSPVLVRVYDDKENARPNIGQLSNPQSSLGFSGSETAMNDARMLDVSDFVPSDSGAVDTAENQAVLNRFSVALKSSGGDTADIKDSSGRFTKGFVNRFKSAMFAKAFKNQSLAETVTEDNDPDLKNILNALQFAAPSFAKIDDAQNLEIRPAIADAFGKIRDARARGYNLEQYEAQADLLEQDGFTETLVRFMWANQRSPRRLGESLAVLAKFIDQELTSRETIGLFGDDPQNLAAVTERVNKFLEAEYGENLQQYIEEGSASYDAKAASNDARSGQQDQDQRSAASNAEAEEVLKAYSFKELAEKAAREDAANKQEKKAEAPSKTKPSDRNNFSLFDDQLELFEARGDSFAQSIAQIINKMVRRSDATEAVKSDAKKALTGIAQAIRQGSVLANVMAGDFAKNGTSSILGKKVHSAADLAAVSQVLRDPRLETFRYVFVKDGVVVSTTAISSRLPSSTAAISGKTPREREAFLSAIKMRAVDADQVYLLHNHPSGNPQPSDADIATTQALANEIGNLAGHVVIDTNKYSVIANDGTVRIVDADFGAKAIQRVGIFARKAQNAIDVARLGAEFKKPGWLTLISVDAELKVNGVMELPVEAFADPSNSRIKATISQFGRRTGAGGGVFLAGIEGSTQPFHALVTGGFLVDAVPIIGISARMSEIVSPKTRAANLGRAKPIMQVVQEVYSPKVNGLGALVEIAGISAKKYEQTVEIAESGKKVTVESRMDREAESLDARLNSARQLKACL